MNRNRRYLAGYGVPVIAYLMALPDTFLLPAEMGSGKTGIEAGRRLAVSASGYDARTCEMKQMTCYKTERLIRLIGRGCLNEPYTNHTKLVNTIRLDLSRVPKMTTQVKDLCFLVLMRNGFVQNSIRAIRLKTKGCHNVDSAKCSEMPHYRRR